LPFQAGNLTYTFSYNAPDRTGGDFVPSAGWGELSGLTLPSGAKATYQYHFDNDSVPEFTPGVMKDFPTAKQLVYRPEYDLGTGSPSNTTCNPQNETCITENWTYDTADNNGVGSVTGPDGGVSTDYAVPTNYSVSWQYWNVGLVYKSVRPDGTMVERIWATNNLANYNGSWSRADNTYVKTEFTSIKSGSTYVKTAAKDYSYDKNGNVTRVAEYDWVDYSSVPRNQGYPTGVPGVAPTRVTTTGYYNSTPDSGQLASGTNVYWHPSAPALKKAAAWSQVSNNSNTLSRSELTYDNASTTGNVTQQMSWDSTKGVYSNPLTSGNSVSVVSQYASWNSGATGKLTQATDGNGNVSRLTYGDIGNGTTDLYVTRSVTGDNSAGTSTIKRTADHLYNFGTGAVTRVTDDDNNVYTSTTYDVFGRPTLVEAADGKTEETQTSMSYDDTLRRVITRSDLSGSGDQRLVSIQHYDQLGRVRLARQLEDSTAQTETDEQAGIKVQTRYVYHDSNSYMLVSNPYRASSSSGASGEQSMGWTRSVTDNGGRVVEVQTFGGATPPGPWAANTTSTGTVSTSYDAQFTTVTDQAGKARRSMTNGLGQLIRVDEPGCPTSDPCTPSLGATGSPNQPTGYTYDALFNLTTVSQGSQTRTFVYSSLGRLLSAQKPEMGLNGNGTINYQYDANGNLTQKTDARGVVSTYAYDALDRNTSVSYSNDPAGTPSVYRDYDGATNGKGRLWHAQTVGANGDPLQYKEISSYDALGRPLQLWQNFRTNFVWSPSFLTQRTYNRAGAVLSQSYPSGRTVNFSYDNAGRTDTFGGYLGDGSSRTYASSFKYDPAGRIQQEQFGTSIPLFHKQHFNSRGQLADIRLSTVSWQTDEWNWNRGAIENWYDSTSGFPHPSANGTDNNGSLLRSEVYIPDQMGSYSYTKQSYSYDSLNRLTSVAEFQNGSTASYAQAYLYDRYGNRRIDTTSATWGTGINKKDFAVDMVNNRLSVPSGQSGVMTYDSAGNLINDTYSGNGSRSYDAENRMYNATDGSGSLNSYGFDMDGQRVRRNTSSDAVWQLYGMDGELEAEYLAGAVAATPLKEYGYRNGQLLVTASNATAVNLSSGKSATQSSTLATGTTDAGKAIDGNTDGALWDGHEAATNYSANAWWQVDLGSSQQITSIQVWGRTDCCPEMTSNFYIFVSDNSFTSTDLNTTLNQSGVSHYLSSGYSGSPGTFPINRTGRYVRVQLAGTQYLLIGEVQVWGQQSGTTDMEWLVPDQLGTARMVAEATGSLANVKRHDYLPFGEEIFAGQGGRTQVQGFSVNDGIRQQFTSKERDNETGLDYFGARYYSSTQGRFTGVDVAGPVLTNPQTLNKYQYCLNNPLSHADHNGLYEEDVHRDLTYALALAAGFNMTSATRIAAADQWTDDNPATNPDTLFPGGNAMEKRRLYHFTTQERRSEMWQKFETSDSLDDLGTFFHAEQDSFSHFGFEPRMGHMSAGHAPDKTYNDPEKADHMAYDTFCTLLSALSIRIRKGEDGLHYQGVDWQSIFPLVQAFNRAKTADEKKKIIDQIVSQVQSQHYIQLQPTDCTGRSQGEPEWKKKKKKKGR
jgi:RHS repeat-associated protein